MIGLRSRYLAILLMMPVWALANTPADRDPVSVQAWLDKISKSTNQHSYTGTFVYRCNAQLVALKIIHGITKEGERQKLVSLNGPAQQIFSEKQPVVSLLPQKRQSVVKAKKESAYLPGQPLDYKKELDNYYSLTLSGNDRVAGRPSTMVTILPKDNYRYGFRLWVDDQTDIVLRSDMVDGNGQIIEQVMFTGIEFIDNDKAVKLLGETEETPDVALADGDAKALKPDDSQWQVTQLPDGFSLAEHYFRHGQSKVTSHEQMVFTDGLASVSVFIEKQTEGSEPFIGNSRMGAMNAFGNVVEGYQVTVVGDVPSTTIKIIGQSVTYSQH